MRIGIAGPISTESVQELLPSAGGRVPRGMGGAPLLGTLINALTARGHHVSAYTLDRGISPAQSEPVVLEGKHGFRIFYGPYRARSFSFNGRFLGRAVDRFAIERRALLRAITVDQPDVVHAHWLCEFAMAARDSRRPHLVTSHDAPARVLRFMPSLYRLVRFFMARDVLRSVAIVTAVSPHVQADLSRWRSKPVQVVPNPAPTTVFKFGAPRTLSDVSSPKIACVLNGWSALKNPEVAFRAFGGIRRHNKSVSLHLFGVDYGPSEVAERWARKHQLSEGVVFHGATSHDALIRTLSNCDILLHPSLEEACPLAVIEAMALGLPVIGGQSSGGVPWVLGNGEAGVVTDVSSPGEVMGAMQRLLTDFDLYQAMSRAAMSSAIERFHPGVIAEKYEALYKHVLKLSKHDSQTAFA